MILFVRTDRGDPLGYGKWRLLLITEGRSAKTIKSAVKAMKADVLELGNEISIFKSATDGKTRYGVTKNLEGRLVVPDWFDVGSLRDTTVQWGEFGK